MQDYDPIADGEEQLKVSNQEFENAIRSFDQYSADDDEKFNTISFFRVTLKNSRIRRAVFDSPERIMVAIDAFLDLCEQKNLVPSMRLFALFCSVSYGTLLNYLKLNDERGLILRSFNDFILENINQIGFSGKKNTTFTMYYLKSVGKQYDQPDKHTFDINVGTSRPLSLDDPTGGFGAIDVDWKDAE